MSWNSTWIGPLILLLALTGCGDDDASSDGGTGEGGVDSGGSDAGFDAGATDAGPTDDDFEGAIAVGVDAPAARMGEIDATGDVDMYTFDGAEGDWLQIIADADPENDDTAFVARITLFDGMRRQIAEASETVPRVTAQSEIITRLPGAGTYYIRVEDVSDPPGDGSTYSLSVDTLDPGASFITQDREAGDDAASAVGMGFTRGGGAIGFGTFRDMTDVDVYAIALTTDSRLSAYVMPCCTDGHGSTTNAGNLWVTDMTGTTIIGRIDNRVADWDLLNAPLPRGSYLLWVEHPGTVGGANDFYVLKVFRSGTDNSPEQEEATNGTLATAEVLTLSMDPVRAAFILAQIPDGDVDYFAFDVMAGEQVTVACGADTSGSGIRDLMVEVRDDMDMVLSSGMETPPTNAFISDAMIPAAGTYYLRLAKGMQDAEVTGTWVRCAVRASIP